MTSSSNGVQIELSDTRGTNLSSPLQLVCPAVDPRRVAKIQTMLALITWKEGGNFLYTETLPKVERHLDISAQNTYIAKEYIFLPTNPSSQG